MQDIGYSSLKITIEEAKEFATTHYNIIPQKTKKLPGEVDFNFYIKSETGEAFTLKVSRPEVAEDEIEFQSAMMNYLEASNFPLEIPKTIPSSKNEEFIVLKENRILRLQKWVPGKILDEVNPRNEKILKDWGKTVGLLSKHLQGFDHPAAHRFYKWNPSETLYSKKYRGYLQGEQELEIADYFWDLFESSTNHKLPELRKSVNYNDAHEHNLLVSHDLDSPKITGLIDFGDALYSETINELAIACAYACMHLPDPLQAAAKVVSGYQARKEIPLKCLRSRSVGRIRWNFGFLTLRLFFLSASPNAFPP